MRTPPAPAPSRTIHVVGDAQGIARGVGEWRRRNLVDDLRSQAIPHVAHRIQVGDFVETSAADFAPTRAFLDGLPGSVVGTLSDTVVGNHDERAAGTPERAAELLEMPALNYARDYGFAVGIFFYIHSDAGHTEYVPADWEWLDEQLAAYADRVVLLVAHPPLRGTVPNNAAHMSIEDDAALRSAIEAHPCVKAYLCGHSHNSIRERLIIKAPCGGRTVWQINGSALVVVRPNDSKNYLDELVTLYLTVEDDHLEVRARNHGARRWVPFAVPQQQVHVLPFA